MTKIQKLNNFLFNKPKVKFMRIFYLDPLLLFTQHHFFRDYGTNDCIVPPILKEKNCYLFSFDNWHWSDTKYRPTQHQLILNGYHMFIEDYPNVNVVFIHPDNYGIEGYSNIPYVLFNRNALLNPNKYTVAPIKPYKYDAIYNANFYRYKRHELISKLSNVGLIYYLRTNQTKIKYIQDDEIQYGVDMRNNFKQNNKVELINDMNGIYTFLSQEEICKFYNQSYCGLCLSDIEGACLASMEYLLSGLPVISTKNIGGRDTFLINTEYAITNVDSTEDKIYEAVEYFKSKNINRNEVRQNTLARINIEWQKLFKYLNNNISIKLDKNLLYEQMISGWNDYSVI